MLARESLFLHEKLAFIFRIRAARPHVIKLKRPGDHVVTTITNRGRAKGGIVCRGVGSRRIVIRPQNFAGAHVTRRAGDAFRLIGHIIARVLNLDRLFNPIIRDFLDERGLLIFQRRVAVEADPDVPVLFPIGLEKWVPIGVGMNAGFPFFINRLMALPA